jgi:hypothetical protein
MCYLPQLHAIPTVGYSGVLTSYITALQWSKKGKDLIQEGCDKVSLERCFADGELKVFKKYPGKAFKVAKLSRWAVVVSGPKLVDDIRKADDALSFDLAIQEVSADTWGP